MDAGTMFGVMLAALLIIVVLCVKPLGSYIADVMQGRPNFASRAGGRVEALLYRLCGVDSAEEMPWTQCAIALLLFNVLGAVVVYGLQRLQLFLPLNPQKFAAVSPDSSFNTAAGENFAGYKDATTVEKITYQNPKTDSAGNPVKDAAGNAVTETATTQTQTLPMGPIVSG